MRAHLTYAPTFLLLVFTVVLVALSVVAAAVALHFAGAPLEPFYIDPMPPGRLA